MFLRTTRAKELERRFTEARRKSAVRPGRSRANLSKSDKERVASSMAPTTIFDILWRLRKKANYDDADVFVLGALTELDALRLGRSLAIVTDATVAALEALIAAYVGPTALGGHTTSYHHKVADRGGGGILASRAKHWERRVGLESVQRRSE